MSAHPCVLASAVRLSRNDAGIPFPGAARDEELQGLRDRVTAILEASDVPGDWEIAHRGEIGDPMSVYLSERGVVGRDFSETGTGAKAVGLFRGGKAGVEINNTDHIRLLAETPGEGLEDLWTLVSSLDDLVGAGVPYAFHERWGYMTARPREAGTGLRVRVTVLLPVLMVSGGLGEAASELNADGLMIFPVMDGAGGVFRVSALGGRGIEEIEVINSVQTAARSLAEKEQALRRDLLGEYPVRVHDYIGRALGVAQQAWSVGAAEAWTVISAIQLGTEVGILEPEMTVDEAFTLMQRVQEGHVMVDERNNPQGNLQDPENDIVRARILRTEFSGVRAGE